MPFAFSTRMRATGGSDATPGINVIVEKITLRGVSMSSAQQMPFRSSYMYAVTYRKFRQGLYGISDTRAHQGEVEGLSGRISGGSENVVNVKWDHVLCSCGMCGADMDSADCQCVHST